MKLLTLISLLILVTLSKNLEDSILSVSNSSTNSSEIQLVQNTPKRVRVQLTECQMSNFQNTLTASFQNFQKAIYIQNISCNNYKFKEETIQLTTFNNVFEFSRNEILQCSCDTNLKEIQFDLYSQSSILLKISLYQYAIVDQTNSKKKLIITIVVIPTGVLLLLCLVYFLVCFKQQKKNKLKVELKSIQKLVPELTVQKLFEINDKLKEQNDCQICLVEWDILKDLVRLTPCNHFFHSNCIDQWLLRNQSCPICRYVLTQENILQSINKAILQTQTTKQSNQNQNQGQVSDSITPDSSRKLLAMSPISIVQNPQSQDQANNHALNSLISLKLRSQTENQNCENKIDIDIRLT